ncbi:hypothetical protein V8E36_008750 [Tilletia maclaganii]
MSTLAKILNSPMFAGPCLVASAKTVLCPDDWVFLKGKPHVDYRRGLNTLFNTVFKGSMVISSLRNSPRRLPGAGCASARAVTGRRGLACGEEPEELPCLWPVLMNWEHEVTPLSEEVESGRVIVFSIAASRVVNAHDQTRPLIPPRF